MGHLLKYTVRRPSGLFLITDTETGKVTERESLSCVHCQYTWMVEPGSGHERGFCFRCDGVTCGNRPCDTCEPVELWAERMEGKISLAGALHRIRAL